MSLDGKDGDGQQKGKNTPFRTDLVSALSAFDRAQDWADLIHDLQRVNRVFAKHDTGPVIPKKSLLAKRLAQCLSASLPSGVHLKALETYRTVFNRLGLPALGKDLPIYSSGLFPLLSYSATSVKPVLLDLYADFFLPLGDELIPVLDGFVLALLPGLDDETTEFYGKVQKLFFQMRRAINDDAKYFTSLWRSLMLSPSTRISAASYLSNCYKDPEIPYPPANVLAPALAMALQDPNVLVERSVLDLLSNKLPPDAPQFGSMAPMVARGVLETLLRRDLSLTKRVHSWLCGPQDGAAAIIFFKERSLKIMLEAIELTFTEHRHSTFEQSFKKTGRILLVLLDREEIRVSSIDVLAVTTLRYAMQVRQTAGGGDINSIMGYLMEQFTPEVLLAQMHHLLSEGIENKSLTAADFELLSLTLSYSSTENAGTTEQSLAILMRMTVHSLAGVQGDLLCLRTAISFCIYVSGAIEPIAVGVPVHGELCDVLHTFAEFFEAWTEQVAPKAGKSLWSPYDKTDPQAEEKAELLTAESKSNDDAVASVAAGGCALLVALCSKVKSQTMTSSIVAVSKCTQASDTRTCMAGIRAFLDIAAYLSTEDIDELTDLIESVVYRCWRLLHPGLPSASSKAAELWLSIEARFPKIASAVMADGMLSSRLARRSRNLERYSCLWRLVAEHRLNRRGLDHGLFLMLDALSDPERTHRMIARVWLADALLIDPVKVCDEPLHLLLGPETATSGSSHEYITFYDAPRALYAFQTLQTVIEKAMETSSRSHRSIIGALEDAKPSAATAAALAALYGGQMERESEHHIPFGALLPAKNYTQALAITALGFIRAKVPDQFSNNQDEGADSWLRCGLGSKSFFEQHAAVSACAAEFLASVLLAMKIPTQKSSRIARDYAEIILHLLRKAVDERRYVLQIHLTDTLEALLAADGKSFERKDLGENIGANDLPCSAAEASPNFLPIVVRGLVLSASSKDNGGDSTGLRRRWVSFVESAVSYLGEELPAFTDAILGTMTRLIMDEAKFEREQKLVGSDCSHVDDQLLILRGLAQLIKTALEQFDESYPLSLSGNGLVGDPGANEEVYDGGTGVTPQTGSSAVDTAMSAMNPLKFFTDLKEMIVGGVSDPHDVQLDPRREALRVVFGNLPQIIPTVVQSWMLWKRGRSELMPKEGSAAHRVAIIDILEPILRRHPTDLLAAFTAYWYVEQRKYAGDGWRESEQCNATMSLLFSLKGATPEFITMAVYDVFEVSLHWDEGSSAAVAGKTLRQRKKANASLLGDAGSPMQREASRKSNDNKLKAMSMQQPTTVSENVHRTLLNAGEFFAEFPASDIQVSSLEFQSYFYEFCTDGEDIIAAWPSLYNTVKEVLAARVRPSVKLEILNLLSSFARHAPIPLPDRRHRRELSQVATMVASSCIAIAMGNLDPNALLTDKDSNSRPQNGSSSSTDTVGTVNDGSDRLKRAYIVGKGMTTLAQSLVQLLDAAFVEERQSGVIALLPAIDAAMKVLKPNVYKKKGPGPEPANEIAMMGSAKLLQECSKCEWSLKSIEREIISLLEDVNFFENKDEELLRVLAATLNTVLKSDKSLLASIGSGSGSQSGSGITAVFAGRNSELAILANTIHRIAFCVFFGENEQYSGQVPSVLEKLRDSLRVHTSRMSSHRSAKRLECSIRLTTENFLCLRVLILRTGPGSVAPFRASTIAELLRVLEHPVEEPMETMAALRFLDLVALLRVPDFAYEQCFFFTDFASGSTFVETPMPASNAFKPLVTRIANLPVEGFDLSNYGHFRVDECLPVVGGPVDDVDAAAIKAYAINLIHRIELSVRVLAQPNLKIIDEEMEAEFLPQRRKPETT